MHRDTTVEPIRVLLVEPETSGGSRVAGLLGYCQAEAAPGQPDCLEATCVPSLAEAVALLHGPRTLDVILFDFDLADATGPAALVRLLAAAADLPVVVLGDGLGPESVAAIRQGAQDWIPKAELDPATLARTIRHAIARKHVEVELRRQLRRLQKARSRTQRQAAELRARARELDATNRELDDFVYVVSHDLKEPLRGIKTYCETFTEDYQNCIPPSGIGRLRAIMAMCERLETQIADLLTYYRVGRMQPTVVRVDLGKVVDAQVAAIQSVLERRNGMVRVKGSLPTVHGHPVLLGMVLGNLISNGLKYNHSARPTVEVGAVAGEPCTIYVRDNGIGIAAEHHEAIFSLFRRLHGRKEYEGSGTGLTIVRKIISNYGGRIWVQSEPGRGSTFFFSLPRGAGEPTRPPHWDLARLSNPGAALEGPSARDAERPS